MKSFLRFIEVLTFIVVLVILIVSTVRAQVAFENITASSLINSPSGQPSYNSMWIDLDNDDFLDLYIARGSQKGHQQTELYLNNRNGTFKNISTLAFPGRVPAYNGHICWADYDNDGLIDLYEGHFDASDNRLWHQNKDHSFSDSSVNLISTGRYSTGCVWSDIDGDGLVDLFINTQAGAGSFSEKNNRSGAFSSISPFLNPGQGHLLLSVDINNDNIPDFYLGNIHTLDFCYVSQNGAYIQIDNSFLDNNKALHEFQSGAFADIDNDGFPDYLYVQNHTRHILHNNGGTSFTDWSKKLGFDTASTAEQRTTFIQDIDNDGFLDMLIQRVDDSSEVWYGSQDGFIRRTLPFPITNEHESEFSWTDYDNDGFIDLLHVTPSKTTFWKNKGNDNRWLSVTLRGRKANQNGIGTKVFAYLNGSFQDREVGYNQGTLGYSPLLAHFGFGPPDCSSLGYIDSLVVIWQPGGRQVITNVRMNELVVVDQDSGIVRTIQRPLGGGAGYAQNFSVFNASVPADTIVQVPIKATLISSSQLRLDTISVTELTFRVLYNSNILDVTPSKIAQRYTPPTGWSLKNAVVGIDSITITISNDAQQKMSKVVDLGALRFDTYFSQPYGTFVTLNSVAIRTIDGLYSFCTTTENNFLAHIRVGWSTGVASADPVNSKLIISPDPIVGGVLQLTVPEVAGNSEVLIYDALGRELLRERSEVIGGALRCRVDALSVGTYYARVIVGQKHYVGTFRKLD